MSKSLHKAKRVKNDEFYTRYEDIVEYMEDFVKVGYFKGKKIIMPCDNTKYSNFWKFFYANFEELGLREINATFYDKDDKGKITSYNGNILTEKELKGDGSILSDEVKALILKNDLLITNPPFSISADINSFVFYSGIDFIMINALTAINQTVYWPFLKDKKFHILDKTQKYYKDYKQKEIYSITTIWFTNILGVKEEKPIKRKDKHNKEITPVVNKTFKGEKIYNVPFLSLLPDNYDDKIFAVPITLLMRDNDRFTFIGFSNRKEVTDYVVECNGFSTNSSCFLIEDGDDYKFLFVRLLVKMKY